MIVAVALADDSVNLPQISTRTIQQAHVNDIRTALSGDFLPRGTGGTLNDNASYLGNSSDRWEGVNACGLTLYGSTATNYATINPSSSMSGGYTWTWPPAFPASEAGILVASTAGVLKAYPRPTSTAAPAGGMAVSGDSNWSSATTGSFITPTSLTVTIVTLGRPVHLMLIPNANQASFGVSGTGSNPGIIYGGFYNGSSIVGGYQDYFSSTTSASELYPYPCATASVIDFPAAGTQTYTFQMQLNTSGATMYNTHCILAAWESL